MKNLKTHRRELEQHIKFLEVRIKHAETFANALCREHYGVEEGSVYEILERLKLTLQSIDEMLAEPPRPKEGS